MSFNSLEAPVRDVGTEPQLTLSEFHRLGKVIHQASGIALNSHQHARVELRLRKRMKALGLTSFTDYLERVFDASAAGEEMIALIDAVTVNKSDFFREPAHFDYLIQEVVPEMGKRTGAGVSRPLDVWSSACATGEEPYTLAMVLRKYQEGGHASFQFSVQASDICTEALHKAVRAIYHESCMESVPEAFHRTYFLHSKASSRAEVRVAPEIRNAVRFARFNLVRDTLASSAPMDVIFCRNAIIYFDKPTQGLVVRRLTQHLRPGGYLFMGHSEVLNGFDLPLTAVAPTVYRRKV